MDNYINIIKTSFMFFPLIAFIFNIPFILINYHKYGKISLLKTLIMYTFILYLICAYFLVILPLPSISKVMSLTTKRVQLIPFSFVTDFIRKCPINIHMFTNPKFYVPVFNVFLTLPFAVYIRYYFNTSLFKTIFYTFLLSLFFELTQLSGLYFIYPRGYRLFDVDDLILNTFGGLCGYFISKPLLKLIPSNDEINDDSLDKGIKRVTNFRKACSLIFDLFLFTFIFILLSIFIHYKYLVFIVFICYYFILPLFMKGQTLSERYLNILIVNKNDKVNLLRTILRRLLFIIIYFINTYIVIKLLINIDLDINKHYKLVFYGIVFIVFFLFYLITFIKYLFVRKRLIYEKISGTKLISTLKK